MEQAGLVVKVNPVEYGMIVEALSVMDGTCKTLILLLLSIILNCSCNICSQ